VDALGIAIEKKGGVLYRLYGPCDKVLEDLIEREPIDAVFINKDYTPFSRQRDASIRKICQAHGLAFEEHDDALLCAPGSVIKNNGGPYTVFTPFYKKALTVSVPALRINLLSSFARGELKSSFLLKPGQLPDLDDTAMVVGGRGAGLTILKGLGEFNDYDEERDFPALGATTRLSAHLKFGTLSCVKSVRH